MLIPVTMIEAVDCDVDDDPVVDDPGNPLCVSSGVDSGEDDITVVGGNDVGSSVDEVVEFNVVSGDDGEVDMVDEVVTGVDVPDGVAGVDVDVVDVSVTSGVDVVVATVLDVVGIEELVVVVIKGGFSYKIAKLVK